MRFIIKKGLLLRLTLIILLIFIVTIPTALFLLQPGANLQNLLKNMIERNDPHNSDNIIMGIALYQPSGEATFRMGSAPSFLLESELTSEPIVDERDESLKLIHDISHLVTSSERGHIYIEFDINEMMDKFRSLQLLGLTVLIIISTLFMILYRKNQKYRKKIESQVQLVRLGEIARTLTHEIKNPLGAIRMQTGFLRRLVGSDDNGEIERLFIIEEEVQRLALLTDRIGDFLQNPLGNPVKIDLGSFINEMIKRFDGEIHFNDQREHRVYVEIDGDRLRSVIENLLKNAMESMEDLHEKKAVEVFLSSDGKKITLSIVDSGTGISREQMKRVFDPFFTSKVKGSGIGLFVARRFVEAAGGALTLHNSRDNGTEARIIFKKVENR